MKRENIGVGLDIGHSYIKVVQLRNTPGGVQLEKFGIKEIPKKVSNQGGVEVDPQKVIETIREVMKISGIKTNQVVSAISGRLVSKKFIEFPFMTAEELRNAIVWEAEKHIPYKVEEVFLDTHILREKTDKEGKKIEVLLVAAKKEVVNNHLKMLAQAGLKTEIIDSVSFALVNSLEFSLKGKEEVIALVDIGAEVTHLCILERGILKFNRGISLAGVRLTNALREKLSHPPAGEGQSSQGQDLSFKKAEEMKKDAKKETFPMLKPVLEQLTGELQRTFDYYKTNLEKVVNRVMLTGGGSKLKGLKDFFAQELDIPVEMGNLLQGLKVKSGLKDVEAVMPFLSVAIGLALRACPLQAREIK